MPFHQDTRCNRYFKIKSRGLPAPGPFSSLSLNPRLYFFLCTFTDRRLMKNYFLIMQIKTGFNPAAHPYHSRNNLSRQVKTNFL